MNDTTKATDRAGLVISGEYQLVRNQGLCLLQGKNTAGEKKKRKDTPVEPRNVLVYAEDTSLMSERFFTPNILDGSSFIVTDRNGALLERHRESLEGRGYRISVFNISDECGIGYRMFGDIHPSILYDETKYLSIAMDMESKISARVHSEIKNALYYLERSAYLYATERGCSYGVLLAIASLAEAGAADEMFSDPKRHGSYEAYGRFAEYDRDTQRSAARLFTKRLLMMSSPLLYRDMKPEENEMSSKWSRKSAVFIVIPEMMDRPSERFLASSLLIRACTTVHLGCGGTGNDRKFLVDRSLLGEEAHIVTRRILQRCGGRVCSLIVDDADNKKQNSEYPYSMEGFTVIADTITDGSQYSECILTMDDDTRLESILP